MKPHYVQWGRKDDGFFVRLLTQDPSHNGKPVHYGSQSAAKAHAQLQAITLGVKVVREDSK